jgi:hypothetical protein
MYQSFLKRMQKALILFFLLIVFVLFKGYAQDTLPHISVKNIGDKNIISWKNMYGARISNISIQRSPDSLRNFTTIGTVLDPLNKENGFVDNKALGKKVFYRVFVAFEGGTYLFSKAYLPKKDSVVSNVSIAMVNPAIKEEIPKIVLPTIVIAPKGYKPSKLIYTGKDNNVVINLPSTTGSKYSIKFFDEEKAPVFEIHKITEPYLIIEKVNFLHSGWFYFELYDNGVLKEKHKFYIPKEGKFGIPPNEQDKKD